MTTTNIYSLLSPEDLLSIFSCGKLYEQSSFHYIEKDKTYDVGRDKSNFLNEAQLIFDKYQQGHTIIVKNLDSFNESIRTRAATLGKEVDVHMYLVPPNGSDSFPYHTDDRDVVVHMVFGEKTFYLKDSKGVESKHELKVGDELSIKKEVLHKAVPRGGSCLLSFGIHQEISYEIPTPFSTDNLL